MVLCEICSKNNNASYKCPSCRISYCTVACFKIHKETKCEKVSDKPVENQQVAENFNYITEDTIPAHKLTLLENSEELKGILENKHVRDILLGIDRSEKPGELLERAMQEPIFTEFADACLKLVEDKQKESP